MWLLYVAAARLGGGGMFDQCGYYMSLLQDLVEEGMFDQCGYYMSLLQDLVEESMFYQCGNSMSLLQDLVEEACLINVVAICHCCKTWWRGHV